MVGAADAGRGAGGLRPAQGLLVEGAARDVGEVVGPVAHERVDEPPQERRHLAPRHRVVGLVAAGAADAGGDAVRLRPVHGAAVEGPRGDVGEARGVDRGGARERERVGQQRHAVGGRVPEVGPRVARQGEEVERDDAAPVGARAVPGREGHAVVPRGDQGRAVAERDLVAVARRPDVERVDAVQQAVVGLGRSELRVRLERPRARVDRDERDVPLVVEAAEGPELGRARHGEGRHDDVAPGVDVVGQAVPEERRVRVLPVAVGQDRVVVGERRRRRRHHRGVDQHHRGEATGGEQLGADVGVGRGAAPRDHEHARASRGPPRPGPRPVR